MPHLIGQTVLQYKIVEKLGEGGMGVVYKAEDTRLRRTVALKFLPHDVETHESERARFLQEAQAAALLNHPNICTIHDIQEYEGEQFIVMECVDGKTLRQLVPIQKMQTAIDYAVQIGEALQEAHSKGIVHRDIKTDNIMVNSKNQIKVMDFGLAKLRGSSKLTKSRSTVGTLAYMAPEQIQGGEVDARSDIFSFGVVLYETLTRQLPFKGEHEAGVMYSILNEQPPDLKDLRSDIPPELVHIIFRCLEKDAEDRYTNVAELSAELRRVKKRTGPVHPEGTDRSRGQSGFTAQSGARSLTSSGPRSKRVPIILAGLLLILGLAVLFILEFRHGPIVNPDMTFRVVTVPFEDFDYGGISPDGSWMVLSANDDKGQGGLLYLNTSDDQWHWIMRDSVKPLSPDISPDGSRVCYMGPNRELYVVGVLAGLTRDLGVHGNGPRWDRQGTRVWYTWYDERLDKPFLKLWSIKPDGTDRRLEFEDSLRAASWPISFDWSPDGDEIAFERSFPDGSTEIIRRNLKTGREQQLTNERSVIDDICWLKNDMLMFSSNRAGTTNIWCMPADGGPLQQFSRGSGEDINSRATFDAKRILYTQTSTTGEVRAISLLEKGERVVTSAEGGIISQSVAPDGKTIFYGVTEAGLSTWTKICRADIEGHSSQQVAELFGNAIDITWSPRGGFASCVIRLPDESTVSKVLDASSGAVRDTFLNASVTWLSEDSLIVNTESRSFLAALGKQIVAPLFLDSAKILPIPGKPYFLYFDRRASRSGNFWLCKGSCLDSASYGQPRAVLQKDSWPNAYPFYVNPYSAVAFFFETVGRGKIRLIRVSLPDLTVTRIPIELSWDRRFVERPYLTPDGREVLYTVSKQHSKLNIVANPFK